MFSTLSNSKNSGLRRAIRINDTALSSTFSLVSGKIKIPGFRSHFGVKIDRSSEQNESNSGFLSSNWMENEQINGIQPMERANRRWLWIGTSFCSSLIGLAVLIVGNQKIISNLISRNGYYPFKSKTLLPKEESKIDRITLAHRSLKSSKFHVWKSAGNVSKNERGNDKVDEKWKTPSKPLENRTWKSVNSFPADFRV